MHSCNVAFKVQTLSIMLPVTFPMAHSTPEYFLAQMLACFLGFALTNFLGCLFTLCFFHIFANFSGFLRANHSWGLFTFLGWLGTLLLLNCPALHLGFCFTILPLNLPTLHPRDIITGLLGIGNTRLLWNTVADLSGDVLTILPWHIHANLSWHISADSSWYFLAVLTRVAALISGDLVAAWCGNGDA